VITTFTTALSPSVSYSEVRVITINGG
jgi:hypothetical protein